MDAQGNAFYDQTYPFATLSTTATDNAPALLAKINSNIQLGATMGQEAAANGAQGWVQALSNGASASFYRATRRRILYYNSSTTEIVYAGFSSGVTGLVGGVPVTTTGQPIPPGGSLTQFSSVAMYFYSADGNAWIAWIEAYD